MPRILVIAVLTACLLLPEATRLASGAPPVAAPVPADAAIPEPVSDAGGQRIRGLLTKSPRILFLGDSITYSGQYVAFFDVWLLTQKLAEPPIVIDAGLPSETVSGLSEEGHAGGKFPRPDLVERLARVLTITRPNLVFACYGINCGIYQPLDEQRLRRYQQGMETLKQQVEASGATLVVITPPYFDDQRAKKSFSYNGVLDRYSQWLLSRRQDGWLIVDLHGPMTREVARRRKDDPAFTFQPDAVHPGSEGHWFMASRLIRWLGDPAAADAPSPQAMLAAQRISPDVLPLIQKRVNLLRDAYLSAAGHQRPGIRAGLPVETAQAQAEQLTRQIQQLVTKSQQQP